MAAVPCPWQAAPLPVSVGIFILRMSPPGPWLLQINVMNSLEWNCGVVVFLLILVSRNVINVLINDGRVCVCFGILEGGDSEYELQSAYAHWDGVHGWETSVTGA